MDTSEIFKITFEGTYLSIQNEHVNCLFKNLTYAAFDTIYRECYHRLDFNFEGITIENKLYTLSFKEQEILIQKVITSWIYVHTVNNVAIKTIDLNIQDVSVLDCLLFILDKKYKKDTLISLMLGANILKPNLESHSNCVQGRRQYYDK